MNKFLKMLNQAVVAILRSLGRKKARKYTPSDETLRKAGIDPKEYRKRK